MIFKNNLFKFLPLPFVHLFDGSNVFVNRGGKTPSLALKRDNELLKTSDDNLSSFDEASFDKENNFPSIVSNENRKPLLVLDMDETLIHTAKDDEVMPHRAPDFTFSIDAIGYSFDVYKRPGVHEFLNQVASEFEVAVWTAGTREYAEPILDWLDCDGVITHRLYRDSCTLHRYGFYVKDLGKLDRSLSEIIIVDNSPHSFAYHRDNGIQCTDYYFDEDDQELSRIGQFLCHIKDAKDFRAIVPQYHEWSPEDVNCSDADFSDAVTTVDTCATDADDTSPALGLIRWTDPNGNRRMRSTRIGKPPSRYGFI